MAKRIKKMIEDIKDATGLGDCVKAVTTALNIPTCEECEERRKKMNDSFPFLSYVKNDLTEEEIAFVDECNEKRIISNRQEFVRIYNKTFGTSVAVCNCGQLYADLLVKLTIQVDKQRIK